MGVMWPNSGRHKAIVDVWHFAYCLAACELPSSATSDERIIEIHGEAFKVHKGLELVLGHLKKFLHDHSVVAVFEKIYNDTISQDRSADAWADKTPNLTSTTLSRTLIGGDISLPYKREFYFDREPDLETKLTRSGVSLYGSDALYIPQDLHVLLCL
ncbi:hypothetical protein RND81_02G167300 [Saponaria officinalis]|uniref:Uncharacterized protein n=1 Tax=Saponaria officinalis TaxID=3572 RepID=A0AAW1MYJ4_SAPOF